MDLPKTIDGNCHVLVFQDYLTKWPLVYPIPDQKAVRIVKLLVEEVVPFFGVPEALLSDRGTNLLSHLMKDVCELLGIQKLNTTAYHPQCDGMVERFNRTLKAMLRKQAATFGSQWDRYLSGVLWAYRNTPHEATGDKPSFLLFGYDCHTPTEAALLPPNPMDRTTVPDYREQLAMSLSTARDLAAECIAKAQKKYKDIYDRKATVSHVRVGDWVLVRFPQEEVGKLRKLSRPWHGPYRVVSRDDPDVTVTPVYPPQDKTIRVHLSRVTPCPNRFPPGFYWYGTRRHSPGRPPKWIQKLLSQDINEPDADQNESDEATAENVPKPELRSITPDCKVESEMETDHGPAADTETQRRDETGRFSLRNHIRAPHRLMMLQPARGRAILKRGVMLRTSTLNYELLLLFILFMIMLLPACYLFVRDTVYVWIIRERETVRVVTSIRSAYLSQGRENQMRKKSLLFIFFLSSSSCSSDMHNSNTIQSMQILYIPNDCSTTEHLPFLVWSSVQATTGELRPRNGPPVCNVLMFVDFCGFGLCIPGLARIVRPHSDY